MFPWGFQTAGAPFQVLAVSQCGGKAAGGTVLTVDGTGFNVGMTAPLVGGGTFGAVTYVSSTRVTITTNAGSGAVQWQLKNGSLLSTAQNYGYLQPPVLNAQTTGSPAPIAPTSGPATIPLANVVVVAENFPPLASWNVPVAVTVGGGSLSSIVLVDGGEVTGTLSAPGTGLLNMQVTVDGVASNVLTNAYTGNPPPIFSNATNVSPSGGKINIGGLNFVSGITVVAGGGIGALTVNSFSTTSLTVTVPPSAAGTYSLTLTNPDSQQAVAPNGLVITSVSTPDIILGANLIVWYRADSGTVVGGNFTAIQDKSGNGNVPTIFGTVAQNTGSANFNGQPTFVLDGVSAAFGRNGVVLGSTTAFIWVVARATLADGTNRRYAQFSLATLYIDSSGRPSVFSGSTATWSTSELNTSASIYGLVSASQTEVSVNNGTPVTTGSGASIVTAPFGVGAAWGLSAPSGEYMQGEIEEILLANVAPNSTQLSQLAEYANLRCALTTPPSILAMTPVWSGGGSGETFRVTGANFVPGMTITIGGGIGACTVNVLTGGTVADCVLPAGPYTSNSYDVVIQNPDGGQRTYAGMFQVTSNDGVMQVLGTAAQFYIDGTQLTQGGGTVSAFVDQAYPGITGNAPDLVTAIGYNAADSDFNGANSWSFNGTSSLIRKTAFQLATSTGSPVYSILVGKITTPTVNAFFCNYHAAPQDFRFDQNGAIAGEPRLISTGNVSWATAVTGSHAFYASITSGTSITLSVSVDNATPVTTTASATAIPGSGSLTWGAGNTGGNNFAGKMAAAILCNKTLTGTQLSRLQAVFHTEFNI